METHLPCKNKSATALAKNNVIDNFTHITKTI